MKIATIIKGWHKLFVGYNGEVTNGITVKTLTEAANRRMGYKVEWDINDTSFRKNADHVKRALGLSDEEYNRLEAELKDLEGAQQHLLTMA